MRKWRRAAPRAHPALAAIDAAGFAPADAAQLARGRRALPTAPAPFAAWADLERYIDDTAGALMRLAAGRAGQTARRIFPRCGAGVGITGLLRASEHWRMRGRTLAPAGAELDDLEMRARAAYTAAKAGARGVEARAFPAFGYMALAPLYWRARAKGAQGLPLLARQMRLVIASATGRL